MLNGIPLIAYTIIEAKKSRLLTDFMVSSDDHEILEVTRDYGDITNYKRPTELAEDDTTSEDALIHAVNWMERTNKIKYDYIIELMCTNPLKTFHDIDGCINKLIKTEAQSVIGVTKLDDHHPARIKKIENDRILDFCLPETSSRRQDLKPDAYIRNGSIYALRRDTLMVENKRFGSEDSRPYIMPIERGVNIDNYLDLELAEILLKKR